MSGHEKVDFARSSSPCPEPVRTRPLKAQLMRAQHAVERDAFPPVSDIWSLYPAGVGVNLAPEKLYNAEVSRHQLTCSS